MENLRFPMFFSLKGKTALVIGGGNIGSRRATVLRDFGATVIVADPCGTGVQGAQVKLCEYSPELLDGVFICVAATNDRETNRQIGIDAKAKNIPVSVADAQDECDFFFPAICTGGNMVAGLVSDGGDHHKTARLAKSIRCLLEENA